MPPRITRPIYFGPYLVTPHVFHATPHTFCLVNIRPLLPGHVLVSPLHPHPRLSQLSAAEVADLFQTVQLVGRMLERVFGGAAGGAKKAGADGVGKGGGGVEEGKGIGTTALNVAVQDGKAAGQSVEHVHVHVIPRRKGDLSRRAGGGGAAGSGNAGKEAGGDDDGGDVIYEMMDGEEGDVGAALKGREGERDRTKERGAEGKKRGGGGGLPGVDVVRKDRSDEEMRTEAEWFAREMEVEVTLLAKEQPNPDPQSQSQYVGETRASDNTRTL